MTGDGCTGNKPNYGTTCRFQCKDKYKEVSGDWIRTCQDNQRWSGEDYKCAGA